MKRICVVGSINMDLVVMTDRFPHPGETLIGKELHTFPGGKGANQAVAAGRLAGQVEIFGKVGDDLYGKQLLLNLKANGVKTTGVACEPGISSGIAVIEVDGSGENQIVIIPGANGRVNSRLIEAQWDALLENDIFLFQLEIPFDTVAYAMKRLKQHGKTLILDPAPARALPEELYGYIDYLTPNETEIGMLSGRKIRTMPDLVDAAASLINQGAGCVILKAGKHGAYIISGTEVVHCPGFPVDVVDTTGAGDAFNAGLALSLARGSEVKASVEFANAVGALATTAKGAQNAMPTYEQVIAFIKSGDLAPRQSNRKW